MWISFPIYEHQHGCGIHDAVTHMARVAALLEKGNNIDVAILKRLEQSWCLQSGKGSSRDGLGLDLPEVIFLGSSIHKGDDQRSQNSGLRLVQVDFTGNKQRVPFELSLGDIVGIRRMYMATSKIQDMLSYSCLAILKSYFVRLKGILSSSFNESLDGKQITRLGVWDIVESASVLVNNDNNPNGDPWIVFSKSLGAKKLKYHVCQVSCVTVRDPCNLQNSRPGFQL